jgi:uncharacterized protein YndB with AHSA1/START domain
MNPITIHTIVKAPIEKVWDMWKNPEHIKGWGFASNDWECPAAENDLKEGGKFRTRMQSKDGKSGFDFEGTYTKVEPHKAIAYTMIGDDARKVHTTFETVGDDVLITQTFDPEKENPIEMQRGGWQAILDNFKKYVEKN